MQEGNGRVHLFFHEVQYAAYDDEDPNSAGPNGCMGLAHTVHALGEVLAR